MITRVSPRYVRHELMRRLTSNLTVRDGKACHSLTLCMSDANQP